MKNLVVLFNVRKLGKEHCKELRGEGYIQNIWKASWTEARNEKENPSSEMEN